MRYKKCLYKSDLSGVCKWNLKFWTFSQNLLDKHKCFVYNINMSCYLKIKKRWMTVKKYEAPELLIVNFSEEVMTGVEISGIEDGGEIGL